MIENEIKEYKNNFTLLKILLHLDDWPPAIEPNQICDKNNPTDIFNRSKAILNNFIKEDIKNKKILDVGSNLTNGKNIYKIENSENLLNVKGQFDIILMYDTLDHLTNISTYKFIKKVWELLSDSGKVYLRCHPFCSRHATHLFHSLNKAYAHLVFDDFELKSMGYTDYLPTMKNNIDPIEFYDNLFNRFEILQKTIIKQKIDNFFFNKVILEKIKHTYKRDALEYMQIQFVDYTLSKTKIKFL